MREKTTPVTFRANAAMLEALDREALKQGATRSDIAKACVEAVIHIIKRAPPEPAPKAPPKPKVRLFINEEPKETVYEPILD